MFKEACLPTHLVLQALLWQLTRSKMLVAMLILFCGYIRTIPNGRKNCILQNVFMGVEMFSSTLALMCLMIVETQRVTINFW